MIALILPHASRFDRENQGINLGPAEELCREVFNENNINYDTDVFLAYAEEFFKGSVKPPQKLEKIILTGERSLDYIVAARGKSLDAYRGVVYRSPNNIPYVATYWPQDAMDMHAVEDSLSEGEDELDTDGDGKSTSPTKRSNYRFWFKQDVNKLLRNPSLPSYPSVTYAYTTEDALSVFDYEGPIFFDIECNPKTNTLLCLAIACGDSPVYSVPVYDWCGSLIVGPRFFARLAQEMRRRRIVVHNALFDLLFLAAFYRLPFGTDIYCTMVAGHRIWPEAEKSLAHQATLYTNFPFHKDESGTFDPRNRTQYMQLREYNAKDVVVLRDIYKGQQEICAANKGLADSVAQAMSSLFDYAWMSLRGLELNMPLRAKIVRDSEVRISHLQRALDILVGHPLNPGSPDQVVKYLHKELGYRPEKTTDKGAPSVAGDALYKIKLKNPKNVAIDVILEMRRLAKLKGSLGFETWIWEY